MGGNGFSERVLAFAVTGVEGPISFEDSRFGDCGLPALGVWNGPKTRLYFERCVFGPSRQWGDIAVTACDLYLEECELKTSNGISVCHRDGSFTMVGGRIHKAGTHVLVFEGTCRATLYGQTLEAGPGSHGVWLSETALCALKECVMTTDAVAVHCEHDSHIEIFGGGVTGQTGFLVKGTSRALARNVDLTACQQLFDLKEESRAVLMGGTHGRTKRVKGLFVAGSKPASLGEKTPRKSVALKGHVLEIEAPAALVEIMDRRSLTPGAMLGGLLDLQAPDLLRRLFIDRQSDALRAASTDQAAMGELAHLLARFQDDGALWNWASCDRFPPFLSFSESLALLSEGNLGLPPEGPSELDALNLQAQGLPELDGPERYLVLDRSPLIDDMECHPIHDKIFYLTECLEKHFGTGEGIPYDLESGRPGQMVWPIHGLFLKMVLSEDHAELRVGFKKGAR